MSCNENESCAPEASEQPENKSHFSRAASYNHLKTADQILEEVKEYYGKKLKTGADVKTNVCQLGDARKPQHVIEALKLIHEDVQSK